MRLDATRLVTTLAVVVILLIIGIAKLLGVW
jgi:hypothetical protein